jgi:hypothetical protein
MGRRQFWGKELREDMFGELCGGGIYLYSFIYDLLLCVSRGVIVPYFKIYVLNIA